MKDNCQDTFTTYRYHKPKYHFCQKVSTKIQVCHEDKTMCFSFAVCNEEDNFSRQFGRILTDKRMEDGFVLCGAYNPDFPLIHNCYEIVSDITSQIEDGTFTYPSNMDKKKYEMEVFRLRDALEQVSMNMMIEEAHFSGQDLAFI